MPRFDNRLAFLLLSIFLIGSLWSCSQPNDIETPVARTELNLSVDRLPEPPTGMIYQLWAINGDANAAPILPANAVSLGRFSYEQSDTAVGFRDVSGQPRSSMFILNDDLFDYSNVVVSVERISDAPAVPSNIMLVDRITGLLDIPIRLNFPLSDDLWSAIVRYNMEAVSDNNRSSGDGSGVWFSSYRSTTDTLPDTLNMTPTFVLTEIIPEISIVTGETLNIDSLTAPYPWDITNITADTSKLVFSQDTIILGIDSFLHTAVTFGINSLADTSYPYEFRKFNFSYATIFKTVDLDIFTQDKFALPDLTSFGWEYKGWVVSPQISAAAGTLTPPGWRFKLLNKNWIPGDTGGILTTGTFALIDQPDDGNPFSLPLIESINGIDTTFKHPNYPGEDFLNGAALSAATGGAVTAPVNLVPNNTGNIGTIFITIEPVNNIDTTSNFPLLAFIGAVPSSRSTISAGFNTTIQVNMNNVTQTVFNDVIGFPEIIVSLSRF